MLTYILVLVGALNWGLVGVGWFVDTNLNIVNLLFGSWPTVEYLIYAIVGLSAVFMLFQGSCNQCAEKKM
ncbi:MAG: DUF378 domain-containing protein [Candidatus Gracilibacteria bacterium]|nr:DUF378 domain-containing protein [Candidatus Gracilibacteria bacterium]